MWIKKINKLFLPILLLIVAVISTAGLYFYNIYLEWENSSKQVEIKDIKEKINNVRKDRNLQIFELLDDNKRVLDKMKAESQITTMMSAMDDIESKYNIFFEGFNYSNGEISSEAFSNTEDGWEPYAIVRDFINDFRKEKESGLDLPFITQLEWMSEIKFPIKFRVNTKLWLPTKGAEKAEKVVKKSSTKKTTKELILERKKEKDLLKNAAKDEKETTGTGKKL